MAERGEVVDERAELAKRARKVEEDIVRARLAINTAGMFLAGKLYEFIEGRMFEPLGYETQNEWLASPHIELKRTQVLRLTRVHRTLCVERNVPPAELEGVSPDKLDVTLDAIKSGAVTWQDAVADAKTLGRRDMRERYRGDPNARLDANAEPEREQCPTCGTWVLAEKLEDGE